MEFHGTAAQYLRAVREEVEASVFTIPGLQDVSNAFELLALVDGLLLTGSFSNVHPATYGAEVETTHGFFDPKRDAVTLPLIRMALDEGVPVFGICRGMQEMNVALGGTLHQALHETPGFADHRPDETLPLTEQFEPAHEIEIQPGGVLARLIPERRIAVNTAHAQGVDRLAPGTTVEAVSGDGAVEAISVAGARTFAVGVQFHPEWGTGKHALYAALFRDFREAVLARAAERSRRRLAASVAG
jgi:putative glutamine amidotransferase